MLYFVTIFILSLLNALHAYDETGYPKRWHEVPAYSKLLGNPHLPKDPQPKATRVPTYKLQKNSPQPLMDPKLSVCPLLMEHRQLPMNSPQPVDLPLSTYSQLPSHSQSTTFTQQPTNSLGPELPELRGMNWCKGLRFRSPPSSHAVALVSYPGSGNTWLRYLLQQATGILTGSIFKDQYLRKHGFPAENVTDGSVLVVKTHLPPLGSITFKSAILLMRNPSDALLSEFNRRHGGHMGLAPKSAFANTSKENKKTNWAQYVSDELKIWESLHQVWLTTFKGPIHVVLYEMLVRDTRAALKGILAFLNHTVSKSDMNCAMSNKKGIYMREIKQGFDPFSPEMYKEIDAVRDRVLTTVVKYQIPSQKCFLPIYCKL